MKTVPFLLFFVFSVSAFAQKLEEKIFFIRIDNLGVDACNEGYVDFDCFYGYIEPYFDVLQPKMIQGKKVGFSLLEWNESKKEIEVKKTFVPENMFEKDRLVKFRDSLELAKFYHDIFEGEDREEKSKNYKFLAYVTIKADVELSKIHLFRLYQKSIRFRNVTDDLFLPNPFISAKEYESVLDSMVKDINFVGQYFKNENDAQNQKITDKTNPYYGKMLFDVMIEAQKQDLQKFLEYVAVRPFIYMGNDWKISEVFATWVVNGAPTVNKR